MKLNLDGSFCYVCVFVLTSSKSRIFCLVVLKPNFYHIKHGLLNKENIGFVSCNLQILYQNGIVTAIPVSIPKLNQWHIAPIGLVFDSCKFHLLILVLSGSVWFNYQAHSCLKLWVASIDMTRNKIRMKLKFKFVFVLCLSQV